MGVLWTLPVSPREKVCLLNPPRLSFLIAFTWRTGGLVAGPYLLADAPDDGAALHVLETDRADHRHDLAGHG